MHNESFSNRYEQAGVDIRRGYEAVELMKKHVASTFTKGVLSDLGGFGGLFELDLSQTPHPVLVCGTDGVGTKLKLAFALDKHDTIGIDCVAMSVNDVICCGAKPQVFLDYIALGRLEPTKVEQIVKGVAQGCKQADCALIGGETAEMPGLYQQGEYDLAGFCTAVVEKTKIFNNASIVEGDVLVALPSSGLHSNGFSLVRQIFNLDAKSENLSIFYPELGKTLGDELLTPTRIYVKDVLSLARSITIKGASHITGGGFFENIPRALPAGLGARIRKNDVRVLPVFSLLQRQGAVDERDMFNTFNMGVGMVLIVNKEEALQALGMVDGSYILGEVVASDKELELL
ncbi:phosphoribosylformylglycinamidine cyclo-ligase [Sphaerochaeta globosa]|uniref:Phosphoribosylformylglycinamidine cyclo-ligase n=1 Tax=Sphaerochaeta globosa (strain ATCC BAA-1886 / DSM 22777 / Buddy) TaxID=158189 RepID=F0RSS2_SPHGB|nr:phosphoribosylformylglycinamidine cyclo-ligase [Sphaerochaeta globosa]ADY13972.1 phosphoribosylformylglycinamidine cyclo-ligase [Sphaerochaeta globosa str. Buddy]